MLRAREEFPGREPVGALGPQLPERAALVLRHFLWG
jgi:hypothetical protein